MTDPGRAGRGFRERTWSVTGRQRLLAAGAVLALAAALLAAGGSGFPAARVALSGGGAWLVSTSEGLATLLDGTSGEVVGSVRVAGPGADITATQSGASAYITDGGRGTVVRIDGATYDRSDAVQLTGGPSTSLRVFPTSSDLLAVDGQRGIAVRADARTLATTAPQRPLAAQPGPGQALVDGVGSLWAIDPDSGDLLRLPSSGGAVEVVEEAGSATAELVRVREDVAVVDGGAIALAADGRPEQQSCALDVRSGEQATWAGSETAGRVSVAVRERGAVLSGDLGEGSDCGRVTVVGNPGDDLGAPVEEGGMLFVPNRTQGRAFVVNPDAAEVVATLDLLDPGAALELVPGSGAVFYNDRGGFRAGVIRLDGGQWRAQQVQKYDPEKPGEALLPPATSVAAPPASVPEIVTAEQVTPQVLPGAPPAPSPGVPGGLAGPSPGGPPGNSPGPTTTTDPSDPPDPPKPSETPDPPNPPEDPTLTWVVDGIGTVTLGGTDPAVQAAVDAGKGGCSTTTGSPRQTCTVSLPAGTSLTLTSSTGSTDPTDMTGCPGTESAVGDGRECDMVLTADTTVTTYIRFPPTIEPGAGFRQLHTGEYGVSQQTAATLSRAGNATFDSLSWEVTDVLTGETVDTGQGSSFTFTAPAVGGSGEEMLAVLTAERGPLRLTSEFPFYVTFG